jgi:putative membrane protein
MRMTIVALASLAASTALAQMNPNPSDQPATGTTTQQPATGTTTQQPATGTTTQQPMTGTTTQQPAAATNLSQADQVFIRDAAAANDSEIRLGRLAVQKGSTDDVRKMGQMMIDDHQKLADRLLSISTREGISLPMNPTTEQQATYGRLSALSGADFDRAYMDQMKIDHQKAITLFQYESQYGSHPSLKNLATSTLPSLRHHQQMVTRPKTKM